MKGIRKIFKWLGWFILWCFILSIALTVIYRFVPVPITPLMVIRMWEQSQDENREVRLKKTWTSIDNISRHLPQAVVAGEDQIFLIHSGFDKEAIERAIEGNKAGKRVKGGSTITQQTAKNVFLWPARNYFRKGLEAYFTLLLEFFWSKERILEVYLNVIEMGDGIYGAEAAAQTYYNKSAADLTRHESAMLAAIVPGPLMWNPKKPTAYNRQRQSWILRNMNNLEPIGFGK
ncbi:MAG TPA: monofunctional biosynthetic peptidoglycan transglycosylase [Anditalea sp.]|nr:monofunctional biosynthetic peptidoglycan transglycosylase [Anditalea sp.]